MSDWMVSFRKCEKLIAPSMPKAGPVRARGGGAGISVDSVAEAVFSMGAEDKVWTDPVAARCWVGMLSSYMPNDFNNSSLSLPSSGIGVDVGAERFLASLACAINSSGSGTS